jgi:hypothetical protein
VVKAKQVAAEAAARAAVVTVEAPSLDYGDNGPSADDGGDEDWASKHGEKESGGAWAYQSFQMVKGPFERKVLSMAKDAPKPNEADTLRMLLREAKSPVACEELNLNAHYQMGYKKVERLRATVVDESTGSEHVIELRSSDEFDFYSMK